MKSLLKVCNKNYRTNGTYLYIGERWTTPFNFIFQVLDIDDNGLLHYMNITENRLCVPLLPGAKLDKIIKI